MEEKQIKEWMDRLSSKLVKQYEEAYGITDKKREADYIYHCFPNGFEVVHFSLKVKKEKHSILFLKTDFENLDKEMEFHGDYKVNKTDEITGIIKKIWRIDYKFPEEENVISDTYYDENGYYFFFKCKTDELIVKSFFSYFHFIISHEIEKFVNMYTKELNNEIDTVMVNALIKEQEKLSNLPKDKSVVIIDLPAYIELDVEEFSFTYSDLHGIAKIAKIIIRCPFKFPSILSMYGNIPRTRIALIFPFEELKYISKHYKDHQDYILYYTIEIVNQILDKYRNITNYYYIPNFSLSDINDYAFYIKGIGSTRGFKFQNSFSKYFKYEKMKPEEYTEDFIKSLKGELDIDIRNQFIVRAKGHFYHSNLNYALIESVLALETASVKFIEYKFKEKKLSKKLIDKNIRGLTDQITQTIPGLLDEEQKKIFTPLMNKCKKAIEVRNGIAHRGKRLNNYKGCFNQVSAPRGAVH
jgi:hypothetical protein